MRDQQGLHRAHHPGVESLVALAAAGQRVIGVMAGPLGPQVGMALLDGAHVQPLQHAEALFAPQRLDHRLQAAHARQRFGRAAGALQVAADQHVDRLVGQAPAQPVGLFEADGIQGHVDLPLEAVLAVPVGLTVANDDQFGHGAIVGPGQRQPGGNTGAKT